MWTCIKLNCPPLLLTFYAKGSLSWIVALTIYERPCENKNSKFNCTPSTKEMIFCTGLFFLLWACRILIICKIWNTILSTLQLACAAKCLNIWRRKKLSYLTILFANGILIILTILIILCLTGWFESFGYYILLDLYWTFPEDCSSRLSGWRAKDCPTQPFCCKSLTVCHNHGAHNIPKIFPWL